MNYDLWDDFPAKSLFGNPEQALKFDITAKK